MPRAVRLCYRLSSSYWPEWVCIERDEEAAEVLLDDCLSADDQQLIFAPVLSPPPPLGPFIPLTATQCGYTAVSSQHW